MSQTYLMLSCLILAVLIESVHPATRGRNKFRSRSRSKASSSTSNSGSSSWESDGNPNDRGIGFGKGGNSKGSGKYAFYVTAQPSYTQQPIMFKRLEAKGYNDIDDVDKDYYAHYDFEFAKSGANHANFQQKFLNHQANHIGKPLVNPNMAPVDDPLGAFASKPKTKPTGEEDARGLLDGLLR